MTWPIRSISLGVGGAWGALFWIGLAMALALAVWAYRAPVPPLPRSSRVLLGTLRFLALALLVLTLFQPVVTVASRAGDRPRLDILVDLSASMALPARVATADTSTRFEVAGRILSQLLPELEREFDVGVHGFGAGAIERDSGPSLPAIVPDRPATALGPALESVLTGSRRPAAIVLVSDGGVNSGSDPVVLAERGAVPVIAVPTSLDSVVHDVSVAECLANRSAFLGQETVVSIALSSQVPVATRTGIVLREEDRILTREQVTLPAGAARVPVEIRFRPDRLGLHRYSIEVETAPGELTAANNHRSFAIRVEEERLQVLIVAERPGWDFTFIRRALAADRTLAVTALVRLDPRGAFRALGAARLKALPARARELAAFGTVVLVGVDFARLPAETRAAILSFAREGGGLLVLPGPGPAGDSELERILPARFARRPAAPGLVAPRLTAAGSVHPVTGFGDAPSRVERSWSELPPVHVGSALEVGLAGEVLVEGTGVEPALPLVVAGRTPGGRAIVVNASLVWRWGFLLAGTTGDDLVERRFWSEAVRWLARGQGGGNLEVFADQPAFLTGSKVTLGARLTDDELKPVGDAEVTVDLELVDPVPGPGAPEGDRTGGGTTRLGPAATLGSYAGDAGAVPPGLYRLRGKARRGGAEWSAEGGHVLVDRAAVEGATPAANPDLLRRLAKQSGGALVTPEEAPASIANLVRERALSERLVEIKLWNHAAIFIAFVTCASLEWFLRRRRGLA